ncbi:MAG: GNAT family N-acetyltransferase [Phycisphaerae bacterium]
MGVQTSESRSRTEAGEITVRRPFSKDLPAMLEISNWATCHTTASFRIEPETLDHWTDLWNGKPDTHPWFVAERGGAVVGFAMASPFKNRCGFARTAEVTVYVHPDHVGTGIGSALYQKLIPTLTAQGFQSLVAVITVPNAGSERLHQQFGFRKVGVLSRVGWKFGRWHDVAYWQLLLWSDEAAPAPLKSVSEAKSLTKMS